MDYFYCEDCGQWFQDYGDYLLHSLIVNEKDLREGKAEVQVIIHNRLSSAIKEKR